MGSYPRGAGGIWAVGSVTEAQRGRLSWEGALGEPHFGLDRPGLNPGSTPDPLRDYGQAT